MVKVERYPSTGENIPYSDEGASRGSFRENIHGDGHN